MKQIEFSQKFQKQLSKIPRTVGLQWKKQFLFFQEDFRHPSLRTKKMTGHRNIWELSINMDFRATFEVFENRIIFRKIGDHSILKNP